MRAHCQVSTTVRSSLPGLSMQSKEKRPGVGVTCFLLIETGFVALNSQTSTRLCLGLKACATTAHTFNPSSLEAEAGGSLYLRLPGLT